MTAPLTTVLITYTFIWLRNGKNSQVHQVGFSAKTQKYFEI